MARKIPMRKDILSGEMFKKQDLIRIVKTKDGEVFADETGKKNGRGAYVVKDLEKVNDARDKKVLESKLGVSTEVLGPVYDEIIRLIYREDIPKR
ncbi:MULTISPECIES: RNase P modulator RnpM [Nosocomiicoccus]|uniref:YlxR family protein n=1 Tax=Nosocomiicoccus massiliensis TaxID=1232430 RepID=A0AAF1BRS8_9STAP|nr:MULTISPECIES: YlxR family protein [Nosocomiicoccus]MDK6863031.1 YlxR family protein [Nosocomiicoccus ampullae]OFL49795.1 DNA-binding protein [Nosocomiicoccus sp. HMSC067E10]OFS62329.1 DNA-binding protein [Nosocomiicoccus sp. HMSC09A07]WOS96308.1 YlxR family protein [Nosocomiicoccus massiliensis]